jgi:hypothetical protein
MMPQPFRRSGRRTRFANALDAPLRRPDAALTLIR